MRLLLLLLLASVLMAQDKPKPDPKPPVLSDKSQKDFFKARSEAQAAHADAEKATQTEKDKMAIFQSAINSMQKECGDAFLFQVTSSDDTVCVPKPPAPKGPAK